MRIGRPIQAPGVGERPVSFDQFDPRWIASALAATGTASVRRRKLPAEHVVWQLVIGWACSAIAASRKVLGHLDPVVPSEGGARQHVTNAAIVQPRDQLGAAPLAALFR
jgi:hypothetical protein